MNVVREIDEMRFVDDCYRFISPLEQGAAPFVFFVEILGIAHIEFFHKSCDAIVETGFKQKVIVIRHKTEREYLNQ